MTKPTRNAAARLTAAAIAAKASLIAATLEAFDKGAYRHPIDFRVVSWIHNESGRRIGAGSCFPSDWGGTYTPVKRWTRTQDGGSSSFGKSYETREELEADMDGHHKRARARFEEALRGMGLAELESQRAFWQGEADKKAARQAVAA